MFSAIRRQIAPATILAFVALVFAITGGAFAASSHGGSSPAKATASTTLATATTAKAKLKAKAGPRGPAGPAGKNGANGPQGPAGLQGPAGPQGATGAAGNAGASGNMGETGKAGESVTNTTLAAGQGGCKEGGAEFKVGSGAPTKACNGAEGKEGTFGGQSLPSGQTLRGVYAATGFATEGISSRGPGIGEAVAAISLALPIATGGTPPTSHYIKEQEGTPAGCTGDVGEPGAEPGNLCVFSRGETNATLLGDPEPLGSNSSTVGYLLTGYGTAAGRIVLEGTWAVTAK
jgi:hypothetical protein